MEKLIVNLWNDNEGDQVEKQLKDKNLRIA